VRPPDTRPLGGPPPPERAEQLAALATQRLNDGHLIEPEKDNARFYVQQALRADPSSSAAEQAQRSLALALLAAARNAIGRREFARSASLIDSVEGLAAPANIDNLKQLLASARRQADADGNGQLLKSAQERLQQDRLLEPPNDSAAYYVSSLRGVDPANAGLAAVTSDLGARLVAKGRRALALEQYDAARSWLDAAASIGYSSPESTAAARDLESALARQRFQANVVNASELALVKSVQPVYPRKAEEKAVEGWVEIEFTVGELGEVKDPVIRAANPPGMFDQAAVGALSQWRYKPVLRDAKPVLQRARIRIRFTLAR
jgi:TonB family protein